MNATERTAAEGFLFTDLYELTMTQLYHQRGMAATPAQFDYFFRSAPDYGRHQAGYCVFAGLGDLLDYLEELRPTPDDLARLRALTTPDARRLFTDEFLAWLQGGAGLDELTIRAVPEGRVVHPGAPLAVVQGPLAAAQLIETALLNKLNYPTLVATKAARLRHAARGSAVADFGMRRGQGLGVNAGTRAALIGGVDSSSNTGMSTVLGVTPSGTHAHSLVQAFMAQGGSELDAFRAYAAAYPGACVLLIDTVDTLASGLPNAITVFSELRAAGHEPVGVRLDSGDLAHLAVECARRLDAAGFADATIVLSNQLDELTILQVITQVEAEARELGMDAGRLVARLAYGVGTNLMVSAGAPALDGVYKLVALAQDGAWRPAIKVSDSPAKTLNPGDKALWRLYDERGKATADVVTLASERPAAGEPLTLHHPTEPGVSRTLEPGRVSRAEPLLVDAWRGGRVGGRPGVAELRERRRADEAALDAGVKRLINPHRYHVSLSEELWRLKRDLVASVRGGAAG